ncbi:MAG: hypothetical protein EA406_12745 [Rhodospirillales bacterium]|nr:MAG: hypothetical protein EA406_12745 [Rhodospirillales bacterium]
MIAGFDPRTALTRWIPWPWLDAAGVAFVSGAYLPLSRGWAAACAAGGDVERFRREAGADLRGPTLPPTLAQTASLARRYREATGQWESLFFADQPPPESRLAAAERRRNRAATRFMLSRTGFALWVRQLPPVRWEIATPGAVEARHGGNRGDPAAAYAPSDPPAVRASHSYAGRRQRRLWLRFPSPVLGDRAWARVIEPVDRPAVMTIIHLHGIAMEPDLWPPARNAFLSLVNHGVRVVRPEGPWHGRRMLKGWYGGEPVLGRGPDGLLTFLRAWVREVAVLIAWARATGSERVAVSGASLGALTAQLVAGISAGWPPPFRPDAVMLVATSGRPMEIVSDGSLARGIGLPAALAEAGWTTRQLSRWLALVDPGPHPAVDPARVIMVLGEADDLTPFQGGLDLAERWQLPADNVFVRPQGHFSVSLSMLNDAAPTRRLLAVMQG